LKGHQSYYTKKVEGLTQDDGAQVIDVSDSYSSILDTGDKRNLALRNWDLQIDVSGETHSGEASIGIKITGASAFSIFTTPINLASSLKHVSFSGILDEIQITPTNFDGISYSVFLVAS
jgi:hypothetical protein